MRKIINFLDHFVCTAKSAYINWIYLSVSGDAKFRAVPPVFGSVAQETLGVGQYPQVFGSVAQETQYLCSHKW